MKFCTNGTENAQVQTCVLLQEETDFTASNGLLEKWKQI